MNKITLFSFITATLFMAGLASSAPADAQERNGWVQHWIGRQWEVRYFITVIGKGNWKQLQGWAAERNAEPHEDKIPAYSYEEVFDATVSVAHPQAYKGDGKAIDVIVIEFDPQGVVTSPHAGPRLTGKIASLGGTNYIMFSTGDKKKDRQYDFAEWFHGLTEADIAWAPSYCTSREVPNPPFPDNNKFYRYSTKFDPTSKTGTFGCREWGYQLRDNSRPYIDVTSYAPKSERYSHGTYIRDFIGWARFEDKKPVIGKHGNTWLCLHDCPKGDKPGIILDIKAWAAKNGWEPPKRPKRMPMFPDPTLKEIRAEFED